MGNFLKYVPGLSVKPLSNTRWECRIDSAKAIRYQARVVLVALVETSKITDKLIGKSRS